MTICSVDRLEDIYYTVNSLGEARINEKMSRFLAFALHVDNADEAKAIVKRYQNDYHDSRHVCWAYMLGADRMEWQLNDNGEPSGTAGKPILGQINSLGLTDVLVVVVRYFGGIKLGTSGLISAYREAARLALEDAGRRECVQTRQLKVEFGYEQADAVMKIVKRPELEIVDKQFDNLCSITINCPTSLCDEIVGRVSKIATIIRQ